MSKILYEGKFITVVNDRNWEYVQRNTLKCGVVSILATTKDNELLLVEQFRIPVCSNVIECPAGVLGDIDKNETPLECAKKELLEETGYISNDWEHIYTSPQSPGITNEINFKFRARNCEKVNDGGGVENESIIVHKVKLDTIRDYLKIYESTKPHTLVSAGIYSGLYFL